MERKEDWLDRRPWLLAPIMFSILFCLAMLLPLIGWLAGE